MLRTETLEDGSIRETYYGPDGRPTVGEEGFVTRIQEVNKNKVVAENWYDEEGNPMTVGDDTYVRMEYTYDSQGNINRIKYYGADGKPIRCKDGYAIVYREFDGLNRLVYEKYFDTDGFAIALEDGTVAYRYEYDNNGNLIRTTRHDYGDREIE